MLETYPETLVERGDGEDTEEITPAVSALRRSTRVTVPIDRFVGVSATCESRQRSLSKKVRLGLGLGLLATKQSCCVSGNYVAGLT